MPNEVGKAYLTGVAKELSNLPGFKRDLLQKLREEVEIYLEEHPEADRETLEAEFGSAKELSELWLNAAPTETVKKGLSQKKKILLAVIAGIVIIAIILTVYLIDRHRQREELLSGYFIETIHVDSMDESEESKPPVVSRYEF